MCTCGMGLLVFQVTPRVILVYRVYVKRVCVEVLQECMCRDVTSDTSIYSYIEVLLVGGVTHIFMHAYTFISVEVLLVGGVTHTFMHAYTFISVEVLLVGGVTK